MFHLRDHLRRHTDAACDYAALRKALTIKFRDSDAVTLVRAQP